MVAVGFAEACTWAIQVHGRLLARPSLFAFFITPFGLVG
jgi:hypothetical protein